jgi:hypothetical protein
VCCTTDVEAAAGLAARAFVAAKREEKLALTREVERGERQAGVFAWRPWDKRRASHWARSSRLERGLYDRTLVARYRTAHETT